MFRKIIDRSDARSIRLLIILTVAAFLVVPLFGSVNDAGAQADKPLIKWRHGSPAAKIMELAFRQMAIEKGFFKKEGLDVELVLITEGATILKAVVADDLQSADLGSSPIFPAIEKGAPIKMIGAFFPGANYTIFGKKDIKKLSDLYGRTIATSAPGALLHMLAVAVLTTNKLDPGKVQFVNIGTSAEVFRAVMAGKVDAGVTLSTYQPEIDQNPNLHAIASVPNHVPQFVRLGLITSDKTIKEKSEPLTRFLVAYAMGHRYALQNKDETIKLASKITGMTVEKMAWEFDWYIKNKVFDPNFGVTPAQIKYMQELSIQSKAQEKMVPFEKMVNLEFRKKVLETIGEYKMP